MFGAVCGQNERKVLAENLPNGSEKCMPCKCKLSNLDSITVSGRQSKLCGHKIKGGRLGCKNDMEGDKKMDMEELLVLTYPFIKCFYE